MNALRIVFPCAALAVLSGCMNCNFEPTMSANISFYNRGGAVAADSQSRSKGAKGSEADISASGGGISIPESTIKSNLLTEAIKGTE